MITYSTVSIFESPAQTLVNPVNCVGVMGAGLAKEFKKRWPAMFAAYKSYCDEGMLDPGDIKLWKQSTPWILNAATKDHWREKSELRWVQCCLSLLVANYERLGITSIAFPKLGCGLGGLDWADVKPVMERYLADLPVPVWVLV